MQDVSISPDFSISQPGVPASRRVHPVFICTTGGYQGAAVESIARAKKTAHRRFNMKKIALAIAICSLGITAFGGPVQKMMTKDDDTVMVGGMAMYPMKTIVDNAVNSKDHTTLVAAVKAAGLVDVLSGKGPFTVFAPVNSAFAMLPEGTVDMLLKPENKSTLTKILTYHVVAGRIDSTELKKRIKAGHGKATLKTVAGGWLWATMNGPMNIVITDEMGATANISTYDVYQSNGVIQVIDKVLMPK
jgi:uncharacterized surface protein with fasciclin (FAS1) repeats